MTIQYALTFFLIVGVVGAMTFYFKRALQGRIRDATVYMTHTVRNVYTGNVYVQYEPYYIETVADRTLIADQIRDVLPSFDATSGIWEDTGTTVIATSSFSNQARPGLAE